MRFFLWQLHYTFDLTFFLTIDSLHAGGALASIAYEYGMGSYDDPSQKVEHFLFGLLMVHVAVVSVLIVVEVWAARAFDHSKLLERMSPALLTSEHDPAQIEAAAKRSTELPEDDLSGRPSMCAELSASRSFWLVAMIIFMKVGTGAAFNVNLGNIASSLYPDSDPSAQASFVAKMSVYMGLAQTLGRITFSVTASSSFGAWWRKQTNCARSDSSTPMLSISDPKEALSPGATVNNPPQPVWNPTLFYVLVLSVVYTAALAWAYDSIDERSVIAIVCVLSFSSVRYAPHNAPRFISLCRPGSSDSRTALCGH